MTTNDHRGSRLSVLHDPAIHLHDLNCEEEVMQFNDNDVMIYGFLCDLYECVLHGIPFDPTDDGPLLTSKEARAFANEVTFMLPWDAEPIETGN
jgi:hypothetical protein